jgi:hypothetical protein
VYAVILLHPDSTISVYIGATGDCVDHRIDDHSRKTGRLGRAASHPGRTFVVAMLTMQKAWVRSLCPPGMSHSLFALAAANIPEQVLVTVLGVPTTSRDWPAYAKRANIKQAKVEGFRGEPNKAAPIAVHLDRL